MGRIRRVSLIIILVLVSMAAIAQSNEVIDTILGQETVTAGSAAYVALTAAGVLADDSSLEKAVSIAVESGVLAEGTVADDPASFGMLAHLLMQAFEVPGGLMYLIAPGPRYASREFASRGWSPGRIPPNTPISGEFLLQVTGSFLEEVGEAR